MYSQVSPVVSGEQIVVFGNCSVSFVWVGLINKLRLVIECPVAIARDL